MPAVPQDTEKGKDLKHVSEMTEASLKMVKIRTD